MAKKPTAREPKSQQDDDYPPTATDPQKITRQKKKTWLWPIKHNLRNVSRPKPVQGNDAPNLLGEGVSPHQQKAKNQGHTLEQNF